MEREKYSSGSPSSFTDLFYNTILHLFCVSYLVLNVFTVGEDFTAAGSSFYSDAILFVKKFRRSSVRLLDSTMFHG